MEIREVSRLAVGERKGERESCNTFTVVVKLVEAKHNINILHILTKAR